jgi:hypothetical protein
VSLSVLFGIPTYSFFHPHSFLSGGSRSRDLYNYSIHNNKYLASQLAQDMREYWALRATSPMLRLTFFTMIFRFSSRPPTSNRLLSISISIPIFLLHCNVSFLSLLFGPMISRQTGEFTTNSLGGRRWPAATIRCPIKKCHIDCQCESNTYLKQ